MTKHEDRSLLVLSKKIKAINYKGGKCIKCSEKDIFKLCFHHRNPNTKEYDWYELKDKKWSVIQNEIKKCDLMCHNCHSELHYKDNINKINQESLLRRTKYKQTLVDLKGGKCIKCDYNKCISALDFHHLYSTEKELSIGNYNNISDRILDEIEKCEILCKNCHIVEHTNIDFYNSNMSVVLEKVSNYKEYKNIDYSLLFEDFDKGLRQTDIRKKYDLSKSTVSNIHKKYLAKC